MSCFQPLQTEDFSQLRPFFTQNPYRVCDCTAGAAFMWRRFLHTAYLVCGDWLLLRISIANTDYFPFPLGSGDPTAALELLESYCRKTATPLRFSDVPEDALRFLQNRYGDRCQYAERRNSADYLYTAQTFLSFPGRHLAGQRNHVRHFWREHPDCTYLPLTEELVPAAVEFIRAFCARQAEKADLSAIETEEGLRSQELLQHLKELHLSGGVLMDGGNILAVTAGEIVGDTLFVHIEKADTRHRGVYQAISSSFAQHMLNNRVKYINREDDAGDEGLRRSKLSYRPCALLTKYAVTVKNLD